MNAKPCRHYATRPRVGRRPPAFRLSHPGTRRASFLSLVVGAGQAFSERETLTHRHRHPYKMLSSSRRVSQAPSPHVNLHCTQCDSQIGIFDNEWTRLTSSYVRPAHPGTHFGTEIANKTQVVPDGVAQRALEGCTLAEVFCTKCSAAVGQYCKAAPAPEQRRLV